MTKARRVTSAINAKITPVFSKPFLMQAKPKMKAEKIGHYAVKQPLTVARVLPKDLRSPSSTLAYGKKTAIFCPREKDFTGIVIDSEGITESNRAFFDALRRMSRSRTISF